MTAALSASAVKSATRTLDIIEYVVAAPAPIMAKDISAALAIPVSSLSYLLATLVERGYLTREDGRHYAAGPGLVRLQAQPSEPSLADRVTPLTRMLRLHLNETSSFFVRHEWRLEALVTESSDQALRYAVPPGAYAALHAFAGGKALLAAMADEELDAFLAQCERQRFTDATLCDEGALRAELDAVRTSGIARSRGEHSRGIVALARAATRNGQVVGAFSVAIPDARFDAAVEARTIDLLRRVTDALATD